MNESKKSTALTLGLLGAMAATVSGPEVGPSPVNKMFNPSWTRRERIELLKSATGWIHCRCRELVDANPGKSTAELVSIGQAEG